MNVFIHKNQQQTGPFSQDDIYAMLDRREITPQDLAWTEGLPDWQPLSKLLPQQAKSAASPPPPPPVAVSVPQVRPWVRYWARIIDIQLFSLCCTVAIGIIAPSIWMSANYTMWGIGFLFAWCFIEPIFLLKWGAAPGKALLRVSVRHQDGSLLHYFAGLGRSVDVWFRGLGIGFPLVGFFTLLVAYNTLTKHGVASWDKSSNTRVTHQLIGPLRVIAAILLLLSVPVGAYVFGYAMGLASKHA